MGSRECVSVWFYDEETAAHCAPPVLIARKRKTMIQEDAWRLAGGCPDHDSKSKTVNVFKCLSAASFSRQSSILPRLSFGRVSTNSTKQDRDDEAIMIDPEI